MIWNDSTSSPLNLTPGVPQGSILGPLLFLIMVAALPDYITQGITGKVKSHMMCYADDSTLYASSKCIDSLVLELERMCDRMLAYCKEVGLVINSDKTQMLVSGFKNKEFSIKVGNSKVHPSKELNLLGVTYDSNFSTVTYLRQLASDAKTRASIISRLSYSVPPHLLRMFTNGLLVGKIMLAATAAIPFRITHEDKGTNVLTERINCSIKSAARTITKVHLTDKVRSDIVLKKAGLKSLNEMVASAAATMIWKSKMIMDPLGKLLFPKQTTDIEKNMCTRSESSNRAKLPVPGFSTLAANLLARAWNESSTLQNSSTIGAAKLASINWARSLQF